MDSLSFYLVAGIIGFQIISWLCVNKITTFRPQTCVGGLMFVSFLTLGFAPSDSDKRLAEDGKPFTTLLYANGPGYKLNGSSATCPHDRENLTDINTSKLSLCALEVITVVNFWLKTSKKLLGTARPFCWIFDICTGLANALPFSS